MRRPLLADPRCRGRVQVATPTQLPSRRPSKTRVHNLARTRGVSVEGRCTTGGVSHRRCRGPRSDRQLSTAAPPLIHTL